MRRGRSCVPVEGGGGVSKCRFDVDDVGRDHGGYK